MFIGVIPPLSRVLKVICCQDVFVDLVVGILELDFPYFLFTIIIQIVDEMGIFK